MLQFGLLLYYYSMIAVCKPKEECDELEAPRNLKPGEKLVIEEQGCCPTHKIACNKSECPNDIMQCNEPYYEAIMQDETNSCCPSYICQLPKDKCIVNYEEQTPLAKNVFEKWTHPTEPCKHEACIFGANGTAQIKSTIEVCDTQCAEGFTYLPGNSSTCCGKCEQSACLFETKIYKKHEVWHSLDNCTHYKCDISSNNLLIVTTSKETCPDIANCAPNQIVNNGGCCKYCIALPEKIENKSHCLSTVLASNATVELISINKDGHGICANKEAIKDFSVCQGTCTSGTKYNKDTLTFEKMCDCCSITSYKKLSVPLICKTGLTFNYEIEVPNSCGCQPCIESVDNNINPQFDVRMDSEILSMNTIN